MFFHHYRNPAWGEEKSYPPKASHSYEYYNCFASVGKMGLRLVCSTAVVIRERRAMTKSADDINKTGVETKGHPTGAKLVLDRTHTGNWHCYASGTGIYWGERGR